MSKDCVPFDKVTANDCADSLGWIKPPRTRAVPALKAGASRAEWIERRRHGIGASDIASVVGISPWGSPFKLWWEKHLGWDLPPSDAMADGLRVEEWAQEEFTARHPELFVARPWHSMYADPYEKFMICTPDFLCVDYLPEPLAAPYSAMPQGDAYTERARIVYPRPEFDPAHVRIRPLEVKSDSGGEGWGAPGTDEVPDHYALQVKWQCHIFGADGGWLVRRKTVGQKRYTEYYVPYVPGELEYAISEARRFMTSLELGTVPDPDGSVATLEALKQLHPAPEDGHVAVVDAELAARWRLARRSKAEAAEKVRLYDNMLRDAMGRAAVAVLPDGTEVARRRIGKRAGYEVGPCEVDELRMIKGGAEQVDAKAAAAEAEEGNSGRHRAAGALRGPTGAGSGAARNGEEAFGGTR